MCRTKHDVGLANRFSKEAELLAESVSLQKNDLVKKRKRELEQNYCRVEATANFW